MNTEISLKLIKASLKSRVNSYAPYSGIHVGAALLCSNGKIYKGSNIECASFSSTICAERAAFSKAITEGELNFEAIAISSNQGDYIFPCGACRQFMIEFAENLTVVLVKSEEEYKTFKIKKLLPNNFSIKEKK